jgi:hypothetical protein
MEKSYFKEEQKFDQVWYRMLIIFMWIPMVLIFGSGIYQQFVLKKPWGDNPTSDTALLLTTAFVFLIMAGTTWLMLSMKLITEVTENGIRYRFPPLINKFKTIPKQDIAEYNIRKYSPIGEYGGWGIKGTFGFRGRAYNVKGNIGLQLRLQNNKKVLFGTQRQAALQSAMDKLMKPSQQ